MRFIGSKAALLGNIEQVINENTSGDEQIFCDIFSGTGAVARHFKPRYQIISNDFLHFSYVLQRATIENNVIPEFKKLRSIGILDPFSFLEETRITETDISQGNFFITKNYSPNESCRRMYLSPANAMRIDFIRSTIESWRTSGLVNEGEYYYLLAGLIEGVPFVSNITGTYGAYLKQWDKRSYKDFEMVRLEVTDNGLENRCYNTDSNKLIKELEGDILYIDPPYNSRQYAPNYHLLETISRYDGPEITGVTGMRNYDGQKSDYCVKGRAPEALEELVSEAKFRHIILSYSTDGIMSAGQIEKILKKHTEDGSCRLYTISHRKYKSKIVSPNDNLKEYIFYARKKIERRRYVAVRKSKVSGGKASEKKYIKSPLNYIGGKYKLLPQLLPLFPKDISTFVDLFSGGANVAINVQARKIICNDLNSKIIELFRTFQQMDTDEILARIDGNIEKYGLSKTNEEGFKAFREHYNLTRDPIDLYTLTCFSFNYQFRFNNSLEYNNPFGRNRSQFSQQMRGNLTAFLRKLKDSDVTFLNRDFAEFNLGQLGPQDMIYCDPPYLITTGSYNDGNRGFKDWGDREERQLLEFLDEADRRHIRFALSNVLEHKGRRNDRLIAWSSGYNVHELVSSYANSSYNTTKGVSREVLITNYER
ncbi:MAG: Dam family site-specific DNA-(adenine-N6)-methyltransferase [Oscillospiraceae bacterium]